MHVGVQLMRRLSFTNTQYNYNLLSTTCFHLYTSPTSREVIQLQVCIWEMSQLQRAHDQSREVKVLLNFAMDGI